MRSRPDHLPAECRSMLRRTALLPRMFCDWLIRSLSLIEPSICGRPSCCRSGFWQGTKLRTPTLHLSHYHNLKLRATQLFSARSSFPIGLVPSATPSWQGYKHSRAAEIRACEYWRWLLQHRIAVPRKQALACERQRQAVRLAGKRFGIPERFFSPTLMTSLNGLTDLPFECVSQGLI